MDPLSIARSAISLASACQTVYLFLKKVRDGDPTVISLRKEIQELETTVDAVRSVADSSLVNQLVAGQWQSVHRTLKECEITVRDLMAIIGKLDSTLRDDLVQRLWKQLKVSGFKSEDIAALQKQMASNRQTLNLSLQVIILCADDSHAVSTNASQLGRLRSENVTLGSKIDEIADGIEHLLSRETSNDPACRSAYPTVTSGAHKIGHELRDSLHSAREAVLRAPSANTSPTPADGRGLSTQLGANDVELVENWLHNSLTTSHNDLNDDPSLAPHVSFEQIDDAVDEKHTTITVVETDPFGKDDDESLIEFHTIQKMRRLALRAFKRPNYDEAEKVFIEVMRRSELKYGAYYSWKEETKEMLVRTYCNQSKWDLAEEIWAPVVDSLKQAIGRSHPSFYKSAILLMRIHCAAGNRDKAARLRVDLPENYWNDACFEIMEMNGMSRQDASTRVKAGNLRRILQTGDIRKWRNIEVGIKEGGLTGCGARYNLVHLFAEEGHEAPMRLVLALEGLARNLDGVDSQGMTPLHLATTNRHLNIVRLLVAKNAEIEVRTQNELAESALILAALNDDEKMLLFLIDNQADVEGCDAFRWTALHRAASAGAINSVKTLLANGADIGKSGNHGWTPLHCASSNDRLAIVRLLLEEGANPSAKADDDTTPLSLARGTQILRVLQIQRAPSPSPILKRHSTQKY